MEAVEDLVKICPACKEENPVSEVICRVCMSNLTSVSPTRKGEGAIQPDAGERTCRASAPAVLTLSRLSDGRVLPVSDGGVLGRSGESGAFFERDRTVSRQHAKVGFRDGVWHIEDLNSTNGTWVNGKRLAPGRPSPLNAGDLIALSLACELKVI
jgi:hypothetical protein